jgi:ribosome-associated toxin RatA of RatAB toxin-antitoxin module
MPIGAGLREFANPVRWLAAGLFAFAVGHASIAVAEPAVASIDIREIGEGFVVDLVMRAPLPRELAYEVLTDFEHMANWVPNVKESRVVKREGNRTTVEQQGLARFGLLSFPYTTVRDVELDAPASIRSTQVAGSMKRLTSLMRLSSEGGATRLDYHAEFVPGAVAAKVLTKAFIEHEFSEQFEAIVAEMIRRKERPRSGGG